MTVESALILCRPYSNLSPYEKSTSSLYRPCFLVPSYNLLLQSSLLYILTACSAIMRISICWFEYYISLLRMPQQKATDQVTSTTDIYLFIALEIGNLKSGCPWSWLSVGPFFLVCRYLPSWCMLDSSPVYTWRGRERREEWSVQERKGDEGIGKEEERDKSRDNVLIISY